MDNEENALWRGFEARIERLEDMVRELDEALRGSRHKRVIGLLPEYDRMDSEVRKLNAIIFMDSTGKHGLAHDVDVLMGRQAGVDRRSEFRWKYWIPTLLAVLAMIVTVLTNLGKIKENFPKYHPAPLEKAIDQAKHPKGKTLYRVRRVQEKVLSDDTKESLPK
jgi:hypothetical protein